MKQLQVQKRAYIRWLEDLSIEDRPLVGGKNATLGDMTRKLKSQGIATPKGFTTTSEAYWEVLRTNGMISKVSSLLNELKRGKSPLEDVGASIRNLFLCAQLPERLEKEITDTYRFGAWEKLARVAGLDRAPGRTKRWLNFG